MLDRMRRLGRAEGNLQKTVLVGGAGSLGSRIALNLAKEGFGRIIIVDSDIVAEENIGYQEYSKLDIGKNKVEALKNRIEEDHPWTKVEKYKIHVPSPGDPITDDIDIERVENILKDVFNRSDCVVATFDRLGPRLTFLGIALAYNKPIVFASAWSYRSKESTEVIHRGVIRVWREGMPCPLCYTVYSRPSDGDTLYVAHPFISSFVSSYTALIVEHIIWNLKIYPYISIVLRDGGKLEINYAEGMPSKNCICLKRDELRATLEGYGLMKLIENIMDYARVF